MSMTSTLDVVDPTMFDVVRKAWMETLPSQPFDPDQAWEEAGADSLASLHLLLKLERSLGRRLSFDLITPEMTAAGLARLLQRDGGNLTDASGPSIFLLPGIFGDEPVLADFRRCFAERLRFELVHPPTLQSRAALLGTMTELGRFAASEIARRQPKGDLLLAGHSFGGVVAFDAARHLIAAGRRVVFLGLLDAGVDISMFEPRREAAGPTNLRGQLGRLPGRILYSMHRTTKSLAGVVGEWDMGRAACIAVTQRVWPGKIVGVRKALLRHLAIKAVRGWEPTPFEVQACQDMHVLLATSEQFAPVNTAKWKQVCPGLRVVALRGDHAEVLAPASRAKLIPAFEEAVLAACARQR